MADLPLDPYERQALRDAELRDAIAKAVRQSPIIRSFKCKGEGATYGKEQHAGMPGGCKNDGTGCLCMCHDGQIR